MKVPISMPSKAPVCQVADEALTPSLDLGTRSPPHAHAPVCQEDRSVVRVVVLMSDLLSSLVELKASVQSQPWLVSASLVSSGLTAYHLYLRNCEARSEYTQSSPLPAEVTWLNQELFDVFSALCDTLVPSYRLAQCDVRLLNQALDEIHPRLRSVESAMQQLTQCSDSRFASFMSTGALKYGTHKHCADALQRVTTAADKKQLRLILTLLSTSVGSLVLTGYPAPFHKLPLSVREKILRGFRNSSLETKKQIFLTFKRLVSSVYLSMADRGQQNPAWAAMSYRPTSAVRALNDILLSPEQQEQEKMKAAVNYLAVMRDLHGTITAKPNESDSVEVDAVIVGSGCGGGVMAYELVRAGFKVLVLEKGGFFQANDFARWRECESYTHAYEKGGLCTTADGNITVLAGACVGGGSTINWSASFLTPQHVLEEWNDMGLTDFSPKHGCFAESLQYVSKLFHVNTDNSFYHEHETTADGAKPHFAMNENNRLLWNAAEELGYHPEKIPRGVKKCVDCGHCGSGCSHKSKQSTWNALLEPLLLQQADAKATTDEETKKCSANGALYIIPDCNVDEVLFADSSRSKATGVSATASIYSEQLPSTGVARTLISKRKLNVSAKVVVVAAGSIHSPALLLRSKVGNRLVGKGLTLHPVLGAGCISNKETGLANGVSMGVVVKSPLICAKSSLSDSARYDKQRHPIAIETPPIHPAILGLLVPWFSGASLKVSALGWKNFGVFIGISRDHWDESNRVDIDDEGHPVLHYRVLDIDVPNLLAGLETILRLLRATGSKALFYGHINAPWYVGQDDDDDAFEEYIASIKSAGIRPLEMQVFSAHQMSSCRMASDPSEGPVSSTGELFGCKNLFVADGSVLPTSLGINPMITIDAMAHMISKNVTQRLRNLGSVDMVDEPSLSPQPSLLRFPSSQHCLSMEEAAREFSTLSASSYWLLSQDGKRLTRKFTCRNWQAAMKVINELSSIAERKEVNHHPDLHLTQYRDIEIVLHTHSTAGLTARDFDLARLIDAVEVDFSPKWLVAHPLASPVQLAAHEAAEVKDYKDSHCSMYRP